MSEYFPKAKLCTGNVKIELDLSNYMTKAELKKAAQHVSIHQILLKSLI